MAVVPFTLGRMTDGLGNVYDIKYYICDTLAEIPATDLNDGDFAVDRSTGDIYRGWGGTQTDKILSRTSPVLATPSIITGMFWGDGPNKINMIEAGLTGNQTQTLPNISGQNVIAGESAAGAGGMAKVNAVNQSAGIASTLLTNATPTGYYLVHYTLVDTTADVTAGTIQFQINYIDDIGATTQVGAALPLTAIGRDRGSFEVYLASGNITYQTNLVGLIGTARYALRVRCLFLG